MRLWKIEIAWVRPPAIPIRSVKDSILVKDLRKEIANARLRGYR